MKNFANDYLTGKNIFLGIGFLSLGGLAIYSTLKAQKNERILARIRSELNFLEEKQATTEISDSNEQTGERKKSFKDELRLMAKRRFITG